MTYIITQEMYDNFSIIDGIKQCPFGDYSSIKTFKERCSFSEWCSFGERCRFGEGCKINENIILHRFVRSFSGIGKSSRTLYVWATNNGVFCQAGCFFETENNFKIKVLKKYGEDALYLKALKLLKIQPNTYEVKDW